MPTRIDLSVIDQYLSFLSADDKEIFSYICLNREGTAALTKNLFFNRADTLSFVEEFARTHDFTMHMSINRTSTAGRSIENVQAVRVLVLDIDTVRDREEVREICRKYGVGMVIESSPGKFHLYWKLDIGVPLDDWCAWQLGLAGHFGGDPSMAGVAQSIRVPGIERVCKDGTVWMPPALVGSEPEVLTVERVGELFPGLKSWAKAAKAVAKKQLTEFNAWAVDGDFRGAGIGDALGRNATLNKAVFQWVSEGGGGRGAVTLDDAMSYGRGVYEQFHQDTPFTEQEAESVICRAWRDGAERYQERIAELYRFTEEYLWTGVTDRYGDVLGRLGKSVVAFDAGDGAAGGGSDFWTVQDDPHSPLIYKFVSTVCRSVCEDPRLMDSWLCRTAEGKFSDSKHRAYIARLSSVSTRRGLVSAVLNSPDVKVLDKGLFEAKEDYLLCTNGLLNMLTGELRRARPDDYLLRRIAVAWPGADAFNGCGACPYFDNFLMEIFEEDRAMVDFMYEIIGYSLSGCMDAEKAFLYHGSGRNGKTVLLKAMSALLGDYGSVLEPSDVVFTQRSGFEAQIERVWAKIEHRRSTFIPDMKVGDGSVAGGRSGAVTFNDHTIKTITGNTVLHAREAYGRGREFKNRCKLHIAANELPKPQSAGHSIFERFLILPFTRTFVKSDAKEAELTREIAACLPGILVRAVAGYRAYKARGGFLVPDDCQIAIKEYQSEHSVMSDAIHQLYELAPVPYAVRDLYFAYELLPKFNELLELMGAHAVTKEVLHSSIRQELGVSGKIKKRDPAHANQMRAALPVRLKYDRSEHDKWVN